MAKKLVVIRRNNRALETVSLNFIGKNPDHAV